MQPASGLTSIEAQSRLEAEGPNRLPVQRGPGVVRTAAGQLVHFFALLLCWPLGWRSSAACRSSALPPPSLF